jgi:hypothetical protein
MLFVSGHVSSYDVDSDLYKELASKRTYPDHLLVVGDHPGQIEKLDNYLKAKEKERKKLKSQYEILMTQKDEIEHEAALIDQKITDNEDSQKKKCQAKYVLNVELAISKQITTNKGKDLSQATCKEAQIYAGLDSPEDWKAGHPQITKKLTLLQHSKFPKGPHCPIKNWSIHRMKFDGVDESSANFKARAKTYVGYEDPCPTETATTMTTVTTAPSSTQGKPLDSMHKEYLDALHATVMNNSLPIEERLNAKRRYDSMLGLDVEGSNSTETDKSSERPSKRTKTVGQTMATILEEQGTKSPSSTDEDINNNNDDNVLN